MRRRDVHDRTAADRVVAELTGAGYRAHWAEVRSDGDAQQQVFVNGYGTLEDALGARDAAAAAAVHRGRAAVPAARRGPAPRPPGQREPALNGRGGVYFAVVADGSGSVLSPGRLRPNGVS